MSASATTNDSLNFDLLITRAGAGYRAYVIDAPGGDADATFTLPFSPEEMGRLDRGNGTRRGMRTSPEATGTPPSLRDLGSRLYDAVFRDEVRGVLVASQTEAETSGRNLRIRLRFSDDAVDLATLPWEILFDPEQQHFLALSESRPILRYLSLPRSRPPLVVRPPLSILAVLASPTDHMSLNVEQEWQAIETALADLRSGGKVTLERLEPPTFDVLRNRLLGEPVHVLHFVGHGIFEADQGQGLLLFEDAHAKGHAVLAKSLAMLLRNHSSLRLVYLNACEGAIAGKGALFAGVAQTLVQQGVPAAVAMQDEITDAAAIELARTFYIALATGRPVDSALTQARVALAAHESDEWAVPVLFSRSPDNRLFDVVDVLPTPDCPYPGMRPFTEEQADLFFGRKREIDEAVNRLAQHPFLTVVGPSGSGKSSLVFAGILPALRKSHRFGAGEWTVHTMRPSDSRTADGQAAPMQALVQALDLSPNEPTVRPPTRGRAQWAPASGREGGKDLLFVDQFEEVFTLADLDEADRFFAALHALIATPDLHILLTVRADFYPEMMAMGPLWDVIKANRLELTPLGDDELWAAIVQPAAAVGVTVDEALAVALIADAAGEAGTLPLVQETLVLLWEKVERRQLKLGAYRQMAEGNLSGLQVAVDRRANMVYNNLPDEAQPIARRIFLRLIQFGAGRADTRRQLTVVELRASGDDPVLFDQILATLTASRLLTTSGEEESAVRRVDISHEALIGGWGLLQRWIGEQRSAELTRRRLEQDAAAWIDSGRIGDFLLGETRLLEAQAWLDSADAAELGGASPALLQLIEQSRRAVEEARRRERRNTYFRFGSAIAVASLIIIALVINQIGQRNVIREQNDSATMQAQSMATIQVQATAEATALQDAIAARATAEYQGQLALARQLVAQSELVRDEQPTAMELSLLLSVEAMKRFHNLGVRSISVDQALRRALTLPSRVVDRHSLEYPPFSSRTAAFSADGRYVAVGSMADVQVRDALRNGRIVATWEPQFYQQGAGERIENIDISADGRYVVAIIMRSVTLGTKEIAIWEVDSNQKIWHTNCEECYRDKQVTISSDGRYVAFSDPVVIWDVSINKTIPIWEEEFRVKNVAFDPGGSYIAAVGFNSTLQANQVQVWNLRSGERTQEWTLADRIYGSAFITFSSSGQYLTVSAPRALLVWDVNSQEPELNLVIDYSPGTNFGIWSGFAISPDEKYIAIYEGSDFPRSYVTHVYEVATGIEIERLNHPEELVALAFSLEGKYLNTVAALDDGFSIWELMPQGTEIIRATHGQVLQTFAFSPDERLLILLTKSSDDATKTVVQLWSMETGTIVQEYEHPGVATASSFSADGRFFVLAQESGSLDVWESVTGRHVSQFSFSDSPEAVTFSSDGQVLGVAGGGSVQLWEISGGTEIAGLTYEGKSPTIVMGRSGWYLRTYELQWGEPNTRVAGQLSGADSWTYDLKTGTETRNFIGAGELRSLNGPSAQIPSSADGHYISETSNNVTSVQDIDAGIEIARLSHEAVQRLTDAFQFFPDRDMESIDQVFAESQPSLFHGPNIQGIRLSMNGRYIAIAGVNNVVSVWPLQPDDLITQACSRLNRDFTSEEWTTYVGTEPPQQACPSTRF